MASSFSESRLCFFLILDPKKKNLGAGVSDEKVAELQEKCQLLGAQLLQETKETRRVFPWAVFGTSEKRNMNKNIIRYTFLRIIFSQNLRFLSCGLPKLETIFMASLMLNWKHR